MNLDALEAPAGEMVVVLGPGWPGICCTKRSDTGWRAISTARAFGVRGKIGQQVASDLCTVVDDGTISNAAAPSMSTTKARPPRATC